jgi:hypothetical protein
LAGTPAGSSSSSIGNTRCVSAKAIAVAADHRPGGCWEHLQAAAAAQRLFQHKQQQQQLIMLTCSVCSMSQSCRYTCRQQQQQQNQQQRIRSTAVHPAPRCTQHQQQ